MRFLVFGDSKGKNHGINSKVLKNIMHKSSKLNPPPEFIVVCGDSVAGSTNIKILKSQYNNFLNTINNYYPDIKIYPVVGNHEVNIFPKNNEYEVIFQETFKDTYDTTSSLDNYNNTVYYKDFEDTRLIVLNSFHYDELHKITNSQLNWFDKISSEEKPIKILFVHSPAFPTGAHLGHCLDLYPECRDKFCNIIEKNKIDIVFSGHEHNYSRRILNNSNIYQVISGGGGEKLRNKYKDKKDVIIPPIDKFHFLVVDIENKIIKVSAISIKGIVLDSFIINKNN